MARGIMKWAPGNSVILATEDFIHEKMNGYNHCSLLLMDIKPLRLP